jgi:hypothetical protein
MSEYIAGLDWIPDDLAEHIVDRQQVAAGRRHEADQLLADLPRLEDDYARYVANGWGIERSACAEAGLQAASRAMTLLSKARRSAGRDCTSVYFQPNPLLAAWGRRTEVNASQHGGRA